MLKKILGAVTVVAALTVTVFAMNSGSNGSAESGLKVGDFVIAFHPHHLSGPHKGSDACPPCTYGALPAVQFWVNGDDPKNVEAITKTLDERVGDWSKSKFKAFVIFVGDPSHKAEIAKKIDSLVQDTHAKIAIAWIERNNEAVDAYKVNTDSDVKNTVMVYKDMQVRAKFVNLKGDEKGLAELNTAINQVNR